MPDRYSADRQVAAGDAELLPETRDQARRYAEEQRADALVDSGEQHQQRDEAGVDVPVRHRPARLVPICPALILPGVPVEVDVLAGQRHNDQRRVADRVMRVRVITVIRIGRQQLPERAELAGLVENEKCVSLTEPRRRGAVRGSQHALRHAWVRRIAGECAHHTPLLNHLAKFHVVSVWLPAAQAQGEFSAAPVTVGCTLWTGACTGAAASAT